MPEHVRSGSTSRPGRQFRAGPLLNRERSSLRCGLFVSSVPEAEVCRLLQPDCRACLPVHPVGLAWRSPKWNDGLQRAPGGDA